MGALLELPDRGDLIAEVDEELAEFPPDMQARWADVRRRALDMKT